MKLSQLGEFGLIHRFLRATPHSKDVLLGIGDDAAAVLPPDRKKLLLLTCDPVIEGIHFDRSASPYQIGWKVMARNLSDIAAMGGSPCWALVAASLPRSMSASRAMEIQRGIAAAARKFGVALVGGDTSHSRHGIHLTVTLVGEVARKEMITRDGARAGHALCVTGALGGSILGKHLRFEPRVHEGRFLARRFRPSAMIDLSDGLASDLQRLAEQSHVGFDLRAEAIPISAALRRLKLPRRQQIDRALNDGEDYELLFTIAPSRLAGLQPAWKKTFNLPLTRIGTVRKASTGIRLLETTVGRAQTIARRSGYDHFA